MKPNLKRLWKKNGALILTCAASMGVVATGVLSGKAAIKAKDILEKNPDAGVKELAPAYTPAVICGAATIGCIIFSHKISAKEIALLTATCTQLAKHRDVLRTIVEDGGMYDANDILPEKIPYAEPTRNGDLLCFDEYSGRFFRSSKEAVEKAERDLNDILRRDHCASFNDFYDLLGISNTQFGWEMGWVDDYDCCGWECDEIMFNNEIIFDKDYQEDLLIITVDTRTYPIIGWYEY